MGRRSDIFPKTEEKWPKVSEKCLPLLVIREMEIKSTMRNYFISTRMTIIKNTSNKCG